MGYFFHNFFDGILPVVPDEYRWNIRMRMLFFLLGLDACADFGYVRGRGNAVIITGDSAGYADVFGGFDKDDLVAERVKPRFIENGGFEE